MNVNDVTVNVLSNAPVVPQPDVARRSASDTDSDARDEDSSNESASELNDEETLRTNDNHQPNITFESTSTENVYNITLDPSCWLFADKDIMDPKGKNCTSLNPDTAECRLDDPIIAVKDEHFETVSVKEEPIDSYSLEVKTESPEADTGGNSDLPSVEEDFPSSPEFPSSSDSEDWSKHPKRKGRAESDDPDFDPRGDLKENMDYESDESDVEDKIQNPAGPSGPVENWILEDKPTATVTRRRGRPRKCDPMPSGSEKNECVPMKSEIIIDSLNYASENVETNIEDKCLNIYAKKDVCVPSKNNLPDNETSKDTTPIENHENLDDKHLDKTRLENNENLNYLSDEGPLLCIVCGEDFENEKQFREHSKNKHIDVKDICPNCLRWFPGHHRYIRHVCMCGLEKQCSTCDAKFKDRVMLLEHIESKHINLRFKCKKCEHRFETRDIAYAHVRRKHFWGQTSAQEKRDHSKKKFVKKIPKSLYQCPLCKYKSHDRQSLVHHIWRVHKNKDKLPKRYKQLLCTACAFVTDANSKLIEHMFVHTNERLFSCDICNKSFKADSSLRKHEKSHNKKYMCKHCGRLLATCSDLNTHEKTHTGEAAYTCDKCGKGFAQKNSLRSHMNKNHMDSDDETLIGNYSKPSKGRKRGKRNDSVKSKRSKTKFNEKHGE